MSFKYFLEAKDGSNLLELHSFLRKFFEDRLNPGILSIYGDFLDEHRMGEAGELFHYLGGKWRNPKLKKGKWAGKFVGVFYDIFGYNPSLRLYHLHADQMSNSWFITAPPEDRHRMARHIVFPGGISYRLSLTNGQWSIYQNTGDDRVSVVSIRHQATPESERWYQQQRISLRDYKPITVEKVPDDILFYVFYEMANRQVRGGM